MPRKLTGGESRENGMGIVCHAKEFGKITLEAGKRAGDKRDWFHWDLIEITEKVDMGPKLRLEVYRDFATFKWKLLVIGWMKELSKRKKSKFLSHIQFRRLAEWRYH